MKHIKVPIRRLTKLSTRRITMSKASKARQLMTLCMSMLLVIAGSVIVTPTASANRQLTHAPEAPRSKLSRTTRRRISRFLAPRT